MAELNDPFKPSGSKRDLPGPVKTPKTIESSDGVLKNTSSTLPPGANKSN